jgi:hypothetical protein
MRCLTSCCAMVFLAVGCGETEHGPIIFVDANTRNIYNMSISGETEGRCQETCPSNAPHCIKTTEEHINPDIGFCRQCENSTQCDLNLNCDHGWCHKSCTTTSDCEDGQFCTGGFCRKPSFSLDISFTNNGDRNLEIYTDKTEIHGHDDACAFGRLEWNRPENAPPGDTIQLEPNESAMLRIHFAPANTGNVRTILNILSNDKKLSPLPLLLCGQAVEFVCSDQSDGSCLRVSCPSEDFPPALFSSNPDCSSYQ